MEIAILNDDLILGAARSVEHELALHAESAPSRERFRGNVPPSRDHARCV
jgi:hypothetical protein